MIALTIEQNTKQLRQKFLIVHYTFLCISTGSKTVHVPVHRCPVYKVLYSLQEKYNQNYPSKCRPNQVVYKIIQDKENALQLVGKPNLSLNKQVDNQIWSHTPCRPIKEE